MKKTYSKYKMFGGFGLLIALTGILGLLTWHVFFKLKTNPFSIDSWYDEKTRIAMCFTIGLQGVVLLLLMTQCKYIITDFEGVTFINPIFPFIRKTRKWSDYDYYHTVQESSRSGTYEAIWLIKNNKLKDRVSSFYYSNYSGIKGDIRTKKNGQLRINPFLEIFYWFGLKISK